ncbi:MAG: hypothetical protein ACR5K2_03915 [Wolbachia sp.]
MSYQGANIAQYSDGKSIGDKDNSTVDKISLHSAVEIGNLSLIARLLCEGTDLNAIDSIIGLLFVMLSIKEMLI